MRFIFEKKLYRLLMFNEVFIDRITQRVNDDQCILMYALNIYEEKTENMYETFPAMKRVQQSIR